MDQTFEPKWTARFLKDWFYTRPWTPPSDTWTSGWSGDDVRTDRVNLILPIQTMDYNFLDTGTTPDKSLVDVLSLRSG